MAVVLAELAVKDKENIVLFQGALVQLSFEVQVTFLIFYLLLVFFMVIHPLRPKERTKPALNHNTIVLHVARDLLQLLLLLIVFLTDCLLMYCVGFPFLFLKYESDELEKNVYQDYDSDSDVPEELKQDYVDEQTGDAPLKRSVAAK